ncbi:hypothetical protein EDD21DRAFT_307761 [Dissophora ornata]|nr:hypothetical protein EDD21DRAFT_307761 [Dissophora ornata]
MSLQVNFTTHGHDLKAAYESILRPADPKNGDNWTLFGYDKGTNDLKVLGTGNGGLEELEEEFMDGKIQYAFVRVVDPNSQLNKFVLIAWCGDGVPESKKGLFNTHLVDVSQFLKGYHLQINARCEADVTPAQIMKRIDESSGSKYSIHKESYQAERITPLQSAYKKIEIPDIAAMQRKPTKPEPAPKVLAPPSSLSGYGRSTSTSTTPNEPSMNKAQQMRLEREAREKEERERIKREIEASEARERQAQGQSSSQKEAEERRLQEQREREQQRQQDEERQRSQDKAREERAAREKEERERAEAEDAARSAREASRAREETQARDQAAKGEEQRRQQELQREKEEKEAAEKRVRKQREEEEAAQRRLEEEEETRRLQEEEEERRLQEEEEAAAAAAAEAAAVSTQAVDHGAEAAHGSVSAVVLYSYEQAEENEMSLTEGEVIINVTELDVGWWSGESADGTRSGLFPANYVEVIEQSHEHEHEHVEAAAPQHEEEYHAHESESTVDAAVGEALSDKPTAVALYDYTAGEPNEVSFSEGELIRDIEFVTDDWWSGQAQDGATGLFPCKCLLCVIGDQDKHSRRVPIIVNPGN